MRTSQVLKFIIRYQLSNPGVSPSLDDIAAGVNISKTSVNYHLGKLEAMGSILPRAKSEARCIQVPGIEVRYTGSVVYDG